MSPIEEQPTLTKKEGKRLIFECGLVCNAVSVVCLFLAFVSPYWIVSWPRVFSPFKRMGLWEACFAGMVLTADPSRKAYHGCWWILAPEYKDIQGWLMPGWFIWTQIAVTVSIVVEILGFAVMMYIWLSTGGTRKKQNKQTNKRESICVLQTGTIITVVTAIVMSATCVDFAVGFTFDRQWLPLPRFNYLNWSFGFAVLSSFFQVFAMIAQVTYVLIVRQEMREPPKATSMPMYPMRSQKPNISGASYV